MKIKEVPIEYIKIDDKIKGIRDKQNEEAIGRYMERYDSGTTKPIKVKEIDRKNYLLIDGHHRIEAKKRLKDRKIDCEIVEIKDKDVYSKAVEFNQEHGITLTKIEEERVLINLFEEGRTQEEISKVFKVSQQTISKRINSNKSLVLQLSSKIKLSTTNELLGGKMGKDVAKLYNISRGRVSQIWGDFCNGLIKDFETGSTKEEILKYHIEEGINLTEDKLNEIIKGDYNKIIFGDCLQELPKLKDNSIDCVIIDPPYGIGFQSNYRNEKLDKIKNDNGRAFNLLDKSLELAKTKMKKDSHIYIFTSWKVLDRVKPIVEKHFNLKNCIIWQKNNWTAGDLEGNYAEVYELILFATQGKRKLQCDKRPLNIISCDITNNKYHPTEKPIDLIKELINNSTQEKDLILDFFAGAGATLLAAKEKARKWIGIESKKEFVDVIHKRMVDK